MNTFKCTHVYMYTLLLLQQILKIMYTQKQAAPATPLLIISEQHNTNKMKKVTDHPSGTGTPRQIAAAKKAWDKAELNKLFRLEEYGIGKVTETYLKELCKSANVVEKGDFFRCTTQCRYYIIQHEMYFTIAIAVITNTTTEWYYTLTTDSLMDIHYKMDYLEEYLDLKEEASARYNAYAALAGEL